jgi:hypothetical protein
MQHLLLLQLLVSLVKIFQSKKPYGDIVSSTNQFTDEAEASLKEIISETMEIFKKAN